MKNYIQEGDVLTVTAPAAVSSGDGVQVGSIFGVAMADAASGAQVAISREGVFSLPKVAATSWSQGDPLYWDDTNKEVTNTSNTGANIQVGAAAADAASADATADTLVDSAIH